MEMANIQEDWTEKVLIYCIYFPVREVSDLADLYQSIFDLLFNGFIDFFFFNSNSLKNRCGLQLISFCYSKACILTLIEKLILKK